MTGQIHLTSIGSATSSISNTIMVARRPVFVGIMTQLTNRSLRMQQLLLYNYAM